MRNRYSQELKDFIINNYNKYKKTELQKKIFEKFGMEITTGAIKAFGARNKIQSKKLYPKELQQYIKENAKKYYISELIDLINKKFNRRITGLSMRRYLKRNNISFKKIPLAEIGYEEKTEKYEPRIKIGQNKWQLKKRYLYEKYHKLKINKNEDVIFIDGDKNNFSKDNLVLVEKGITRSIYKDELLNDVNKDTKKLVKNIIELKNMVVRRNREYENV